MSTHMEVDGMIYTLNMDNANFKSFINRTENFLYDTKQGKSNNPIRMDGSVQERKSFPHPRERLLANKRQKDVETIQNNIVTMQQILEKNQATIVLNKDNTHLMKVVHSYNNKLFLEATGETEGDIKYFLDGSNLLIYRKEKALKVQRPDLFQDGGTEVFSSHTSKNHNEPTEYVYLYHFSEGVPDGILNKIRTQSQVNHGILQVPLK